MVYGILLSCLIDQVKVEVLLKILQVCAAGFGKVSALDVTTTPGEASECPNILKDNHRCVIYMRRLLLDAGAAGNDLDHVKGCRWVLDGRE